jgi:hypothetical protein
MALLDSETDGRTAEGDTVGNWYSEWRKIIDRGNRLDPSIREWYFANKRRQFFGRNLRDKQYRKAQKMVKGW